VLDLVAGEPVEELAQRPLPAARAARAIVPSAMTELVGVAAVVLVAWFAAGTIWNVRLGREVMRWMQGGLPALGERTTVRWLGSSAVELVIDQGKAQFAKVTVVVFLEPRDLPWWPISRSRGRRDALILRGTLRRAPGFELEIVDPASWSGREALPRIPRAWPIRDGKLRIHHDSAAALERAEALLALAERAGFAVQRLSVRRAEPNFQLHVALPQRRGPARQFFEAVHGLSELALK
jgi:hypothetical protein